MVDIGEILVETTRVFRKGPEVVTRGMVTEVFGYPHYEGPEADGFDLVDLHFVMVGVDKTRAEARRADLEAWLAAYPQPDRLTGGPSYIEVGGEIGSQEYALRLFALGKALGMWDVITPAVLGITGIDADNLAGSGMVMMSGWPRR